jgi:hypothetical protein
LKLALKIYLIPQHKKQGLLSHFAAQDLLEVCSILATRLSIWLTVNQWVKPDRDRPGFNESVASSAGSAAHVRPVTANPTHAHATVL